jgi:putative oxidoreductase
VEPSSAPRNLRGWWIPDFAFSALRAVIGLLLAWHAAQVLFGILLLPGDTWQGAPLAFTDRWFDGVVKLVGGIMLVAGLFTRITSLTLAILVGVQHFMITTLRGNWWLNDGERVTLYCVVLFTFALTGSGLFSMDALIERRRARRSRMQVSMSPWIRRQIRRRELTR